MQLQGYTALHHAVRGEQAQIAHMLLAKGADANLVYPDRNKHYGGQARL